jgi:hypothetical protein
MERQGSSSIAFWWVIWAAAALVIRLLSEGILEAGDGVNHFQIARFSWAHPELFLDHWGKPLFTLFASPFAQLGHWGVALFNACCFAVTCWAADGVLRRAGPLGRWLYAPALLLAPVYGTMVLAGMTEVFFGMLTLLVLRALADQRFVLAAAIASFTPFARPEFVIFLPSVVLWLAWQRQWRALPWLLTGLMVYGVLGAIMLGDALWYFHRDPYTGAEDLYGSGELWQFWERRKHILGGPLLWLLTIAMPASALLWWRLVDERPLMRLLLLVALLPALGIATLHSFLWWKGLKGSLGLERVLATAMPLLVLFGVWVTSRLLLVFLRPGVRLALLSTLIGVPYVVHAVRTFHWEQTIPIRTNAELEFMDRVGAYVAALPEVPGRTVIFHPYIAFRAGVDPFDQKNNLRFWPGNDQFVPGDRLVWDAHFGPGEAALPLEVLLADSTLRLVATLVPKEHMLRYHGHAMEAHIFERGVGIRWQQRDTIVVGMETHGVGAMRSDGAALDGSAYRFPEAEYPFEILDLPVDTPAMMFADLIIKGVVEWPEGEGRIDVIFSEEHPTGPLGYRNQAMGAGAFEHRYRLPLRPPGTTNKMYFWNLDRKPFVLRDFTVEVVRTLQK